LPSHATVNQAPSGERALRGEGFSKSFFGRPEVLKSASVWATQGRITGLFGRNGSGKTTLLRCMLGLTEATCGVTHFLGEATERPRLRRLARRGLFYLPDRHLLPRSLRFGDMVKAVEWAHGPSPTRAAIFNRLGVEALERRWASQLSGGEQRRCEWALALLSRPTCVVADEPLAGVTPKDQLLVARVVRELAAGGCAVVVTGHEVTELLELVDEVVWMTAGTTHGLGSSAQARAHDQFRREYLGPRT